MNVLTRWMRGVFQKFAALSPVTGSRGGWIPLIVREAFTGAWQRNHRLTPDTVLAHHAVYTCITLIASDVGKLRPKLVQRDDNGIWSETSNATFSPILAEPNHFQNHIQFKEWWITSKLTRGNTYALKQRRPDGSVRALYLLDPARVTVLVADDGSVFYRVDTDLLSRVVDAVVVPASEIIHDRMNCLFHPLIGISPIFASGLAARIGLTIQNNSADFFENGANPSGLIVTPAHIDIAYAKELQEHWNANFTGENSGRIAVLGDDMKFHPMRMSAVDAQTIEHLKWTAETVCATFHVPAFKAGIGSMPTYQNAEILNQIYYSDCLQSHIESMELGLDKGLDLMRFGTMGVELDLSGLLRMDTATQYKTLGEGIKTGLIAPNEGRRQIDLKPVAGGDAPYLQHQNYSLEALAKRDAREDPFATGSPPPAEPEPSDDDDDDDDDEGNARSFDIRRRRLRLMRTAA